MVTEQVEFSENGLSVSLVVSRASVMIGMKRTRLRAEAGRGIQEQRQAGEPSDLDHYILRAMIYPDLIAATIEANGLPWPLSFEEFVSLPEALGIAWEEAVYRLNPHWLPKDTEEATEEKKE